MTIFKLASAAFLAVASASQYGRNRDTAWSRRETDYSIDMRPHSYVVPAQSYAAPAQNYANPTPYVVAASNYAVPDWAASHSGYDASAVRYNYGHSKPKKYSSYGSSYGKHGKDGKNGKDGKHGRDGKQGPRGPMGLPGTDGADAQCTACSWETIIRTIGTTAPFFSDLVCPNLANGVQATVTGGGCGIVNAMGQPKGGGNGVAITVNMPVGPTGFPTDAEAWRCAIETPAAATDVYIRALCCDCGMLNPVV